MSEPVVPPVDVVLHGKKATQHDLYAHLATSHHVHGRPDEWPEDPAEMVAAHAEVHREIRREQRIRTAQKGAHHCPGCRCEHPEFDVQQP